MWRFADALGIFTLLEQPVHNSTGGMQALPKFQELLRELTVAWMAFLLHNYLWFQNLQRPCLHAVSPADGCEVYRVKVLMAWFGAETTKPTWLYVNHRAFAAP